MMIGHFRLERCPFDGTDIELQRIVSLHRQIEQGVGRRREREREKSVVRILVLVGQFFLIQIVRSIISTDDQRQRERDSFPSASIFLSIARVRCLMSL